jgi:hypothetical protein
MARESLVAIARLRPAYHRNTDALNNLGWLPKFPALWDFFSFTAHALHT